MKKNLPQLVDMAAIHDDFEIVKGIPIEHLITVQVGGCGMPSTTGGGECKNTDDKGFAEFLQRIQQTIAKTTEQKGGDMETDEDIAPSYKVERSYEIDDEGDEPYEEESYETFTINEDDISLGAGFDMEEYQEGGKRERNAEADDIYRGFLKKIQEVLDVDEETAYVYRALAKAAVTTKNPELKKFRNEMLKNKEISKLVESKAKLKALTKGHDIEEIKRRIKENRARIQAEKDKRKQSRMQARRPRYYDFTRSEDILLSDDYD